VVIQLRDPVTRLRERALADLERRLGNARFRRSLSRVSCGPTTEAFSAGPSGSVPCRSAKEWVANAYDRSAELRWFGLPATKPRANGPSLEDLAPASARFFSGMEPIRTRLAFLTPPTASRFPRSAGGLACCGREAASFSVQRFWLCSTSRPDERTKLARVYNCPDVVPGEAVSLPCYLWRHRRGAWRKACRPPSANFVDRKEREKGIGRIRVPSMADLEELRRLGLDANGPGACREKGTTGSGLPLDLRRVREA